jgi:hypothetical protein
MGCIFEFLTPSAFEGNNFLNANKFLTIFHALNAPRDGVQILFWQQKQWSPPHGSNLPRVLKCSITSQFTLIKLVWFTQNKSPFFLSRNHFVINDHQASFFSCVWFSIVAYHPKQALASIGEKFVKNCENWRTTPKLKSKDEMWQKFPQQFSFFKTLTIIYWLCPSGTN